MAPRTPNITLDGAYGSDDGSLLHTALVVSSLTDQGFTIRNVRGAQRKPGINVEDLTLLKAFSLCCGAEVVGNELGSTELTYVPRHSPRAIHETFSVYEQAKGAISGNALVVLHILILILARSKAYSNVVIKGESYGTRSLNYDYFEKVLLPMHHQQGLYAYPHQTVGGFGSRGKGEVWIEVEPSVFNGFQWLKRGEFVKARMVLSYAEIDMQYLEQAKKHTEALFRKYELEATVELNEIRAREPGVSVTMYGEFEHGLGGGYSVGIRSHEIGKIVEKALESFLGWYYTEATVDAHLAPLLLIPAVFADDYTAFTTSSITPQLQTVVWVIKQFLPARIVVTGSVGGPGKITIGHQTAA